MPPGRHIEDPVGRRVVSAQSVISAKPGKLQYSLLISIHLIYIFIFRNGGADEHIYVGIILVAEAYVILDDAVLEEDVF